MNESVTKVFIQQPLATSGFAKDLRKSSKNVKKVTKSPEKVLRKPLECPQNVLMSSKPSNKVLGKFSGTPEEVIRKS